MNKKITRRNFIKKSAAFGISISLGTSGLSNVVDNFAKPNLPYQNIDVAVTSGNDYFESTKKAINLLGGMSRFVPKNSNVLLLGNVWKIPGTYTKPDIFRAVARMCRDVGAKKITCVSMMPMKNWELTGNAAVMKKEGVELKLFDFKDYSQYKHVPIPSGILLKEAELVKDFYDYDVFINVPICKHHSCTEFSCTMKNLMGLNSYRNNRKFHVEKSDREIDKAEYLAQCIADLNTVIIPTLNVVDATEFIVTNGPMGPGKIIKPRKVIVGTDRVAIESYSATFFNKNSKEIDTINKAFQLGLGEMQLNKVNIKETEV
jgi:uncharacterized protein (DUF362 family)